MLKLESIFKTFNKGTINEKQALAGLSLHLNPGDFVTVIGGNGAGKSTMLNAVAGVWPVDSGRVILDGEDITAKPEHKRAEFIGRVFQDPMMGTAPNMQLEENLALAVRRGERRGLRWAVTQAEREEYREKLRTLGLGLEDVFSPEAYDGKSGWFVLSAWVHIEREFRLHTGEGGLGTHYLPCQVADFLSYIG